MGTGSDKLNNKNIRHSTEKGNGRKSDVISDSVIREMCAGSHNAFTEVYLSSVGSLTDFLEILLHSRTEAEEVAQEVFTYIWENISKIDPDKNFKGYLYTVAKTTAFKHMGRKKLNEKYRNYTIHTADRFDIAPDETVINNELALLIEICIENMPRQRKRVFELSRIDGKSDKEVAQELNISINTVRMHLKLAKKDISKLITLSLYIFFL